MLLIIKNKVYPKTLDFGLPKISLSVLATTNTGVNTEMPFLSQKIAINSMKYDVNQTADLIALRRTVMKSSLRSYESTEQTHSLLDVRSLNAFCTTAQ